MPGRTNQFQRLIAVIQSHFDCGSTVSESYMLSDTITGTKREVDVVVSGRVGPHPVTISIECRDRTRPADVTWVEEMHAKHSRLPTNVLALVSHSSFTPEARRVAAVYGIRCLVLDDVDPDAPDRLFPNERSLWGKGWALTVDRVDIYVGTLGNLAPERFRASPENTLFLEDGTELGSVAELAGTLLRSQMVIDKMSSEARPDHSFLELVWDLPPRAGEQQLCVQKLDPLVLRAIERFRVVAKCVVTVDEFPLRHAALDGLRVAWGTGSILGRSLILVATGGPTDTPRMTLRMLADDPGGRE